MLSSHHPLKITKSFLSLPVSKLSAGKTQSQQNRIRSAVYQEGCSQGWMQFYGTVTTSCLFWQEKYVERSSSCRGFPLIPQSSDLFKYGVDAGVTEISFSCCSGNYREQFLSSFLTTVLPKGRWSFRGISSLGLDRSLHWKIISDRRMISEDSVNPQKIMFS